MGVVIAGFENDIGFSKNFDFTQADNQAPTEANGLATNGQLWIGRTAVNAGGTHIDVSTLTGGTGITITNGPGTITIASTAAATDLHVARFIVASSTAGTGANFTTIASAIASAVGTGVNSTIFLQPGTYTENFTLPANINLCAFDCDALTPNVTIVGKITATSAGTSSISGIRLQTNSDYCLEVTGASATNVFLKNCYINAPNANAIHLTNANAGINLDNCRGGCNTNTFFIATGGSINANYCILGGINTTVNSTFADCNLGLMYTFISCPITISGTGSFSGFKSQVVCLNTIALTANGTGTNTALEMRFDSGNASAVSIGAGAVLPMVHCTVDSSNTNAITGAGTLKYGLIVFVNTSSTVNTSTQTALATLI